MRAQRLALVGLASLALAAPACAGYEAPTDGAALETERAASKLPRLLPPSRGRTFYVATSGNDSAPGTRAQPWRTVQKALRTLRPGERALIRRGTYAQDHVVERAGTPRAPITIAAFPRERVVLRAGSTSGDTYPIRITSGAAYVRVQGFVIERAKGRSSTNVYFEGRAHHVEVVRNEIRLSQDQGIFAEASTRNLHIIGNRIHDNGVGRVSGQHQSHGIYIEGRNHLIANNVVYDQRAGFGIQIYPDNEGTIVVNNTIVGNDHSGIVVGGGGGVGDITIRNNVIAFNSSYGVQMDSDCPTGPVAVDRNVIHGNSSGAVQGGCSRVSTAGRNIRSDPRFVSRGRKNFRLAGGSPAINRARADFSPRVDAQNRKRPRGGGYDVGAYER